MVGGVLIVGENRTSWKLRIGVRDYLYTRFACIIDWRGIDLGGFKSARLLLVRSCNLALKNCGRENVGRAARGGLGSILCCRCRLLLLMDSGGLAYRLNGALSIGSNAGCGLAAVDAC